MFDKVLLVSVYREVRIYSLFQDISNPKLIDTYHIKDVRKSYISHGICCIGHNQSKDGKLQQLEILLFGGYENENFLLSVLSLKIQFVMKSCDLDPFIFEITEKSLKIEHFNSKYNFSRHGDFGYECLLNSNNEATIIIIGGDDAYAHGSTNCSSLSVYNVVRNELTLHEKVKLKYLNIYKYILIIKPKNRYSSLIMLRVGRPFCVIIRIRAKTRSIRK